MKRYAANIITGCRIAFSILLLMFPVFSFRFYAMYLASGITDMIDGTVARKTNSASASGSRFDTIADAVFLVSALLKLLPEIEFPAWALTWIVVIAVIKQQISHGGSFVKKVHCQTYTIMNKITGALLFLLPLTFKLAEIRYSAIAVCFIATAAAIQEGFCIRKEIRA